MDRYGKSHEVYARSEGRENIIDHITRNRPWIVLGPGYDRRNRYKKHLTEFVADVDARREN